MGVSRAGAAAIGGVSRRERRSIAIAFALSFLVHGALLSWRLPRVPIKFGDQAKSQPAIKAMLLRQPPSAIRKLPEQQKLPVPASPIEALPPVASPKLKPDVSPSVPARRQFRKAKPVEPASQAPEPEPETEPESKPMEVADRDASIPEDDLRELREMVKGVGRIRFHLVVNRAGRVEEVTVETTDIPPQLELAVTRRLFSTPFLPAYRTGAPASSPFTLDLEPQ